MVFSQFVQNLFDAFTQALLVLWQGSISLIPKLIVAIVFFAIGWVLAALLERLVESVFRNLKVDAALKSAGIEEVVKRAGHNLNSGLFVGVIVKWFVILAFLIASFNALNLTQVSGFLTNVVNYIPQVIVAVLILMAAVIVASALQKLVMASARAAHVKSAELLGRVTKWSIWIFAILTALITLGIAPALIQMIVTAIFAGLALAVGLAFGLGGKEVAQNLVEKTAKSLMDKD